MRQKGEHCLPDLASTALCMESRPCKGSLLMLLLLRKRYHSGSRQKSCPQVTAHIGDYQSASLEICSDTEWLLWLHTKLSCKFQPIELTCLIMLFANARC